MNIETLCRINKTLKYQSHHFIYQEGGCNLTRFPASLVREAATNNFFVAVLQNPVIKYE